MLALDRSDREALSEADVDEFARALNGAFGHINEPTYRTMMRDLETAASTAVPGIVAPFEDWSDAIFQARNVLAHRGTEDDIEAHDAFINLLVALSYSLAWVLRTVLLVQAEISLADIREAYGYSSAFSHHLTNVRNFLRGGPHAAR